MIFSNIFVQSKNLFMETMINLNDLLKHEILDLYSAEEQIIEAMPAMIDKAKNPELKRALREHLKITEEQKKRLDQIKQTLGEGDDSGEENKGFFSRLFGGGSGEKCKGMEGLITEGEKFINSDDISDEALDAAIIASAQKIEHYEICGYGTAREFAKQLEMTEVYNKLTTTLNEEYTSDNLLTRLARKEVNDDAENADEMDAQRSSNRDNRLGSGSSKGGSKLSGSKGSSKGSSSKGGSKSEGSKGTSKAGSSKSSSSKGGSNNNSKSGGSNSSRGGSTKGGSKSGSSKLGGSKGSSKAVSKGGSNTGRGASSKGGSKGSSKVGSKSGSKSGGSKGSNKGGTKGGKKGGGSRRGR